MNLLYLIPGVVGGTETYAAGLLGGLAAVAEAHEFVAFVNAEAADWPLPNAANFHRVVCPVSGRSLRSSMRGCSTARRRVLSIFCSTCRPG
jgi:hypothetical protein